MLQIDDVIRDLAGGLRVDPCGASAEAGARGGDVLGITAAG